MTDAQSEYLRDYAERPMTDDEKGALARTNNEPLESCPIGIDRQAWAKGWLYMDRMLNPCKGCCPCSS
jgi:hypothetical protein